MIVWTICLPYTWETHTMWLPSFHQAETLQNQSQLTRKKTTKIILLEIEMKN